MGSVVGQASFLFHISQHFLPNLEGISVDETSKLRWGKFHFTFKNTKIDEKFQMNVMLGSLPWGDKEFQFHGPVNLGEAGGHRPKLKVVLALGKLRQNLQSACLNPVFLFDHFDRFERFITVLCFWVVFPFFKRRQLLSSYIIAAESLNIACPG